MPPNFNERNQRGVLIPVKLAANTSQHSGLERGEQVCSKLSSK